jgi:hypothetical protein
MAMTTFLSNELLDHTLRNAAYTSPTTVHLALFTAAPTDAYTSGSPDGTEVSTGGYARATIAFDAGASRATANTDLESFTASGANYGTVVAIGIFDASTNGNLLWWADLDTNRVVNDGDTLEFAAGAIDLAYSASA